jgi:hypothetical protein
MNWVSNVSFLFHNKFYLGIKMKQEEDKIFISQDKLGKEIFKKFKMEDYIKINTPVLGIPAPLCANRWCTDSCS